MRSSCSSIVSDDDQEDLLFLTPLSEKEEVTQRWKEYCEELYNNYINFEEKLLEELKLKKITDRSKEQEPCIRKRSLTAKLDSEV